MMNAKMVEAPAVATFALRAIDYNFMIDVTEAIDIVLAQVAPLAFEEVALAEAVGRVLAEDVVADTDLPPFDRAQMDGYAVRAADTIEAPASLRIVGEAAAGAGWHERALQRNEAVRIMTGAPVPRGADAVQQVELTRESADTRTVVIERATQANQFITRCGSEVRAGQTALKAGERVTAAMIATLASFGYARVKARKRPRVAVLATGAELVAVEAQPGADEIRDSNSHTLRAYAELAGAEVKLLPPATDDVDVLQQKIAGACAAFDALVLSGGVSMGVYDFTKAALRALKAEIFFERVRLRPGKPTVFARVGETPVFGLPGNPVSVAVTFNLFARPALLAMQGMRAHDAKLKEEQAVLARAVKGSMERASYLPAQLQTNDAGQLIAEPLRWHGSSDFISFARANALIIVPEGTASLEANAVVAAMRLPG